MQIINKRKYKYTLNQKLCDKFYIKHHNYYTIINILFTIYKFIFTRIEFSKIYIIYKRHYIINIVIFDCF